MLIQEKAFQNFLRKMANFSTTTLCVMSVPKNDRKLSMINADKFSMTSINVYKKSHRFSTSRDGVLFFTLGGVYCQSKKRTTDFFLLFLQVPFHSPLEWRHNGRDGVSNHQPDQCLLSRLFRRRSRKTSKLRVSGPCVGYSPVTGDFPAQMVSNAENVSIWWRHHDITLVTLFVICQAEWRESAWASNFFSTNWPHSFLHEIVL